MSEIEKLERSTKDYGGGGGSTVFKDDNYNVVHWTHFRGERTILTVKATSKEIQFDGWHNLLTAEDCFNQLRYYEIEDMMTQNYFRGYREGENAKIKEIKKVLGLRS